MILMRHGDALKGDSDPVRALSKKGIGEGEAAGAFLRSIGEFPDIILHSTLLRSIQTAERVEAELGANGLLRERRDLKPEDSEKKFLSDVLTEYEEYTGSNYTIMVVGHNPFISDLAALLGYALPFTTGTLFAAESFMPEKMWDICFYVKARHLRKDRVKTFEAGKVSAGE